jgi:uncharacterized membrane protein SpoIIM required for sporulation
MKETSFIKQNIKKWNSYEEELRKQKKDPKTVSKLFVQITDDLAYAQTFYKNRSVRVYLNGIAQLLFNDINKRNRFKFKSIIDFWAKDLPVILFKTRFELLFSFIVFALMMGIGIITSIYEPDFASSILGEDYVQMTIENIENNDPMAVYKSRNGLDMFLGITVNNIMVAFVTFILGLFFGFGTFFSLIRNGIMVGVFQYFFIERGLFRESFLTIWQHGALEISSIVIAGAAGFTIGRGLILPGTYTRFQSLRITARRGLKIMIGLIPVFTLAAFIEGFFTRHTDVPDIIRLITIILSFAFVLFYFVFYPARIARKYPEKLEVVDKINEGDSRLPNFKSILTHEALFGGTLNIIKKNFLKIIKITSVLAVVAGIVFSLGFKAFFPELNDPLLDQNKVFLQFVDYNTNILVFFFSIIIYTLAILYGNYLFVNLSSKKSTTLLVFVRNNSIIIVNSFLSSILIQLPFFLPIAWAILISVLSIPLILLANYTSCIKNIFLITGIIRTFKLFSKTFGKFLFLNLKFVLIACFILLLGNPGLYGQLLSFIHWNLWLEEQYINIIFNFIACFIYFVCVILSLQVISSANALLYYTLHETKTSDGLLESVKQIGQKKTLRGYELE